MRLRTAAVLMTATLLALASPDAMAAKDGRKPAGAKKKGARTGTSAGQPVRPVRRGTPGGQTLSGTRGRAAMPGAAARRPVAEQAAPQRRVARGAQQQEYRSPLHAARAQQRTRRGRMRSVLVGLGIVAVVGVGIVAGDALGLGDAVSGWFDNIGNGGEQLNPFEQMPDPPADWQPGGGEGPGWPDWAPEKPGGGGGPPSFEQVQEQLDRMMGKTPTPTK